MKYATALLILSLLIISCQNSNENMDQLKTRHTDLNANKINFMLLANEWISSEQISEGLKKDIKNIYYINLKTDSTFNSFYKPDNIKNGFWRLNTDSTFILYMKATDTFRILELTDSTLIVKVLYSSPEIIFKFKSN